MKRATGFLVLIALALGCVSQTELAAARFDERLAMLNQRHSLELDILKKAEANAPDDAERYRISQLMQVTIMRQNEELAAFQDERDRTLAAIHMQEMIQLEALSNSVNSLNNQFEMQRLQEQQREQDAQLQQQRNDLNWYRATHP